MTVYSFVTKWHFDAPVEKVWDELTDALSWPSWWSSYRKVAYRGTITRLTPGAVSDNEVRGQLPYSLRFTTVITTVDPYKGYELESSGDLAGKGKFVLQPKDGGTDVTYFWDVSTTHPVLNLFSKLSFVKTLMAQNHDYVMNQGYEGLTKRLALK